MRTTEAENPTGTKKRKGQPRPGRDSEGRSERKPVSGALRFVRRASIIFSGIVAVFVLLAAYSGHISPVSHGGYWGILGLAFPFVLAGAVLWMLIQILFCRTGSLVVLAALVVSAGPILEYCPLHIFSPKAPEDAPRVKVLTYNALEFHEFSPAELGDQTRNRTMDYIINSGADIVCLQEVRYIHVIGHTSVTAEDLSTLQKLYPYILHNGEDVMLLSKYPVEGIHLDYTRQEFGGDLAAYRVDMHGIRLTIFNVHLQSLGLTQEDKELYGDLTKGHTDGLRQEWREVKSSLLSKIAAANVIRGRQIDKIVRYIEHYGGPNVMVCGDFNDVSVSYSVWKLRQAGLKEVYPQVGLGPIITYNSSRILFGIDHICVRGALRPLWLKRGKLHSSDHYPVMAEFYIRQ